MHSGLELMAAIIEDAGTQCFYAAPLAWMAWTLSVQAPARSGKKTWWFHVVYTSLWPFCPHVPADVVTHPPRRRFPTFPSNSGLPMQIVASTSCSQLTGKAPGPALQWFWIGHLDILTCCAAEAFVYDDRPHTSVVFELLSLVSAVVLHPFPQTTAAHWVLSLLGTILMGYNEVKSSQKVQQSLGTL